MLVSVCFLLTAVCVAAAAPPAGNKLRNVIITSFGELPYDPLESGYYQGEVLPENFEDDIKQQTMDVALRTRILVEDPNEKKNLDEGKELSPEFDEASSNTNDQVRYDRKSTGTSGSEFLTPLVKSGYRTQKSASQEALLPQPQRNFGYSFRQSRNRASPTLSPNGYNFNTEYYGDLGEGWNLRDAEEVLQGRNYNILVQTPNSYPKNPVPPPRETPPPFFGLGGPHPVFYPFPTFGYGTRPRPGFGPYKGDTGYPSRNEDGSGITEGRGINRQDPPYSGRASRSSETRARGRPLPYRRYSDDYLRGA